MSDLWSLWPFYLGALVFAAIFLRPRPALGEEPLGLAGSGDGSVEAYRLDGALNIVSAGYPDQAEAQAMVRMCREASRRTYQTGEDALSETMCGLSRGGDDFVEIDCLDPDSASVRVGSGITRRAAEQRAPCNGVIALDRLVAAYFAGPEAFGRFWYGLPGREEFRRNRWFEAPGPPTR